MFLVRLEGVVSLLHVDRSQLILRLLVQILLATNIFYSILLSCLVITIQVLTIILIIIWWTVLLIASLRKAHMHRDHDHVGLNRLVREHLFQIGVLP